MNHNLEFKAMGCRMIAVVNTTAHKRPKLLDQVPHWFEEWEQSLSRFRESSELNHLNRSAGWPVEVSPTLWNVFQAALEAEQTSEGLVTAAVLGALITAGYDQSFDALPREQVAHPVSGWQPTGSLAEVSWDATTRSVCLPIDMKLDFGGVAKGWAAHQAAKRLAVHGGALVSAGGDIAIIGEQVDGRPWPISVDDPFQPGEMLGLLMLGTCGVATSGTDYRRWKRGGRLNHHIIDPRTGQPAQTDLIAVTVVAPTALEAEVAAKVALILGSEAGLTWIEARPQLAGLFIRETGEAYLSERMKKIFWRSV